MPTRQNSSSGRPKSPRIQVVLPEELCARLALLAERETRTVSNMAKVLIQQGVERLEADLPPLAPGPAAVSPDSAAAAASASAATAATANPYAASSAVAGASFPSAPAEEAASAGPVAPGNPVNPASPANAASPASAVNPVNPLNPASPLGSAGVAEPAGVRSGALPPEAAASAERFRAELERHEARKPQRLRGLPRRVRLRPPGDSGL